MKKILLVNFLLISFLTTQYGQLEFGFRGGVHSVDLHKNSELSPLSDESVRLNFEESNYGYQFGIYTRLHLLGLFIEPAVMLHSTQVNYSIEDVESLSINSVEHNFTNLDIPVMVGMKLGFIRIFTGPVAHLHLDAASEIIDIPAYSDRFETATFGFQAGMGIDIWKLRISAKYEGNLSRYGDNISVGDQTFALDKRPSRVIANVGFRF